MSKRIIYTIFIVVFALNANAQYLDSNPTWKQRIFWGGGFGLTLGSITHIDVSPIVGYRVTNRFSAGIGGTYQYYNYSAYNIKTSIYGGKVFASYTIIKDIANVLPFGENMGGLLLHAEAEGLNVEKRIFYLSNDNDRVWVFSPLAGIGYQLPVGMRRYLIVYVLFNFNEGQNSPYSNPVFRMSLQF
jgi:hypothetical protein